MITMKITPGMFFLSSCEKFILTVKSLQIKTEFSQSMGNIVNNNLTKFHPDPIRNGKKRSSRSVVIGSNLISYARSIRRFLYVFTVFFKALLYISVYKPPIVDRCAETVLTLTKSGKTTVLTKDDEDLGIFDNDEMLKQLSELSGELVYGMYMYDICKIPVSCLRDQWKYGILSY